jgi:hypothetical protein
MATPGQPSGSPQRRQARIAPEAVTVDVCPDALVQTHALANAWTILSTMLRALSAASCNGT